MVLQLQVKLSNSSTRPLLKDIWLLKELGLKIFLQTKVSEYFLFISIYKYVFNNAAWIFARA